MIPTAFSPLATHQGTNPHAAQRMSLVALGESLWRNRQLITQMTRREVMGRYKGSALGLAWSFFNPVFMLVVYTFVFSVIFKSRWGVGGEEQNPVRRSAVCRHDCARPVCRSAEPCAVAHPF